MSFLSIILKVIEVDGNKFTQVFLVYRRDWQGKKNFFCENFSFWKWKENRLKDHENYVFHPVFLSI